MLLQQRKWRYYLFERLKLSPEKTLSSLVDIPGIHVFKIFPTHLCDQSLESIIEKFKPDILFLRRNHLDRLVSHKKANSTGIWHGVSTDSVEIEIDEIELNDFITTYEKFHRKMYRCAVSNSVKIMDVEYENLFEAPVTSAVLNFILGDSEKVENLNIKPRTLKQDSTGASQQAYLRKVSTDSVKKKISDFNFPKVNR
jgi:LPS sulfotransferase NodH